jgi:uncharacterized damage-inducible protein DinB
MTAILARMYEHLRWADEGVYNSLLSATNPPPHSLELFAHVVATEDAWLSRLRGEKNKVVPRPHLLLTQCAELAKRNADDFSAFIAGLDSSQLDDTVTYRNSSGTEFTSTIGDILTHVALHGAYHRGQIAAAVRSGGDTPAVTDFIAFARGVPAAPRS